MRKRNGETKPEEKWCCLHKEEKLEQQMEMFRPRQIDNSITSHQCPPVPALKNK